MEIDDTTTGGCSNPQATIDVLVKFSGKSIPISLSPDSKVKDLKSLLQPITNVLPRGQRLICKGKLLVDEMTLKQSEVGSGAKIMLIASQGLHQGGGPILKEAKSRPISRRTENVDVKVEKKLGRLLDKHCLERWKFTGVVQLAECNLKAIPNEVWGLGLSTRIMDVRNNSIQAVPAQIGRLSSIQRLFLNANGLLDESIKWEGLASLKFLTVLSLSENHLTTLPPALGSLTSLRQLYVANNELTSLPIELGLLTQLELLKANNNKISEVPASIGNCASLIEVDLSSNFLSELPESFGNLQNLKALLLSNNGLKSLPSAIFKMCLQLTTLDLHNTEITVDVLRQFDGWESFNERRQSKLQKQLDFRVLDTAEFDEGADKN